MTLVLGLFKKKNIRLYRKYSLLKFDFRIHFPTIRLPLLGRTLSNTLHWSSTMIIIAVGVAIDVCFIVTALPSLFVSSRVDPSQLPYRLLRHHRFCNLCSSAIICSSIGPLNLISFRSIAILASSSCLREGVTRIV